jgi:hypothetical protein
MKHPIFSATWRVAMSSLICAIGAEVVRDDRMLMFALTYGLALVFGALSVFERR